MKDHAQFADDLALYAMGTLDARECPELQAHLGTCGECRRELEALRADLAMVALSATGPQPPQRSRERLMSAVAGERRQAQHPGPQLVRKQQGRGWLFWAPLAACVLLAAFSIHLILLNQENHREVARLTAQLYDEQQKNTAAKAVMDMLNDPTVQRMTLVSAKTRPEPQIKTFYTKRDGHVLLLGNNLGPLPADKRYQLWLMPADGSAPMPAGLLRIEPDGSAMMMHTMDTPGVEAKSFAITIEPLHGSSKPTMPIMMAPAS